MLRKFQVGQPSAGMRLDLFLASTCSDLSRSRIQRLIEEGAVRVGGSAVKRSHLVRAGEEVSVDVPEHRPAIDKPAGLVVHPSPGHGSGTLVNAVLHHVAQRGVSGGPGGPPSPLGGIGGELRPGIVHRLDRDTSGVLLVAKTELAQATLSRQMKKRSMKKEYLALVAGIPRVRKGEVAFAIGRDPRDRKKMKAFRNAGNLPAGAREARTLYEIEREFFALGLNLH